MKGESPLEKELNLAGLGKHVATLVHVLGLWSPADVTDASGLEINGKALSNEQQEALVEVKAKLAGTLHTKSGRKLAIEPYELTEPLREVLCRYGLDDQQIMEHITVTLACDTVESLSTLQVHYIHTEFMLAWRFQGGEYAGTGHKQHSRVRRIKLEADTRCLLLPLTCHAMSYPARRMTSSRWAASTTACSIACTASVSQ